MADVSVRATLEGFKEVDAALKQTAKGIDSVSDAQTASLQASAKYADAWNRQHQPMQAASADIQKILGQYDPLGAKLRQLQSDFANLDKAIATGATGGTPEAALDKTMRTLNEEITRTKGLMEVAGAATTGTGTSMASLGLNTRLAQQELMMLGREALSGNFSHMPMTFTRLVMHTNLWRAALNPVALSVIGVTAAIAGFVAIAEVARREMEGMNKALIMTSNFAGMTQEHMLSLSRTISNASTLTIGASREIVTQIVASGQYSAENVKKLAFLVDDYATATGKAVDKVTPELVKMFEDPAKASETLNQKYGYLQTSELERIRTLQSTGRLQEAVTLALDLFSAHVPKAVENLGLLERSYNAVAKAMSEMWTGVKTSVLSIGTESLDKKLSDTRRTIAELEARQTFTGTKVGERELEIQKALLIVLQQQEAARAAVATIVSKETQERKDQVKAQEEINKSSLNKISSLEKERDFIVANGVASVEKDRRVLELNKEIRALRRGMAAEDIASAKARIDNELAIFDIQIKSLMSQTDALVKLGRLSQEEADRRNLHAQLEQNIAQQISIQDKLKGNLERGERESLKYKLAQLQVEHSSLEINGGLTKEITAHNKLLKENAELLKSSSVYLLAISSEEEKRSLVAGQFHSVNVATTRELDFQTSLIGKTKAQQEMMTALRKLDLSYEKEKNKLIDEEGRVDEKAVEALTQLYDQDRVKLIASVQQHSDASKDINQFWKTAAKDMQRSMSGFFFDIMQGNLSDLAGSFKRAIDRMMADALAAKAALALFGPDFATPGSTAPVGGLIGKGIGWLGSVFGGNELTALPIFGGGPSVTPQLGFSGYAGGGSFTVGGAGGTDSQTVGFKATPGERVTVETPQQQARGGRDTYYIDARGADAAKIAQLEMMIRSINGSVERRAISAVAQQRVRGGSFASVFG